MSNDLYSALVDFERGSHVMTSIEADFENHTWTFHAASFRCSGGRYVVIPEELWNAFKHAAINQAYDAKFKAELSPPSSQEQL